MNKSNDSSVCERNSCFICVGNAESFCFHHQGSPLICLAEVDIFVLSEQHSLFQKSQLLITIEVYSKKGSYIFIKFLDKNKSSILFYNIFY